MKFIDGYPYFFVCKNCKHRFKRKIKLGLICPKCKSFKVVTDPSVMKAS